MGSSTTDILMATVLPMVGLPLLAAKGFSGDGEDASAGAPPLPANATDAEKAAYKAATEAMRRQRQAGASSDGRGSTILTGGKLGELGSYSGQAKGLLGL